jgi:hypothetical protein
MDRDHTFEWEPVDSAEENAFQQYVAEGFGDQAFELAEAARIQAMPMGEWAQERRRRGLQQDAISFLGGGPR